jgi:hypothetical protein
MLSGVGNPSENKERFRTSRNDKPATECGLTYELLSKASELQEDIMFHTAEPKDIIDGKIT